MWSDEYKAWVLEQQVTPKEKALTLT